MVVDVPDKNKKPVQREDGIALSSQRSGGAASPVDTTHLDPLGRDRGVYDAGETCREAYRERSGVASVRQARFETTGFGQVCFARRL